jgi:hypothetical protein
MDDAVFDRLTRRFVLGGLATGSLSVLLGQVVVEGRTKSKRKRCKKKKRTFCAGRCCPKHRHCTNATCVSSCGNPFTCPQTDPDTHCGPDDTCFCASTVNGQTACLQSIPAGVTCGELTSCGEGTPCPAGEVCGVCQCDMGNVADFRCFAPC